MELMEGGSIHSLVRNSSIELSWPQRWQLARECVVALQRLHSFHPPMVHGNIKSQNFLISQRRSHEMTITIKISDVGMSSLKLASQLSTTPFAITERIRWSAPEVLNHMAYTDKADIYSLGLVLWELAMTSIECEHEDKNMADATDSLTREIISGRRPSFYERVLTPWMEMVKSCWHSDPQQRPTASAVLSMIDAVTSTDAETIGLSNLNTILNNALDDDDAHLNAQNEGEVSHECRGFVAFVLQTMNANLTLQEFQCKCTWLLGTEYALATLLHPETIVNLDGVNIITRSMKEHLLNTQNAIFCGWLLNTVVETGICSQQDLIKCVDSCVDMIKQHPDHNDIASMYTLLIGTILSCNPSNDLMEYIHQVGGTKPLLHFLSKESQHKEIIHTLVLFGPIEPFMCAIVHAGGINVALTQINADCSVGSVWNAVTLFSFLMQYGKLYSIPQAYVDLTDLSERLVSIIKLYCPHNPDLQIRCYAAMMYYLGAAVIGDELLQYVGGFDDLFTLILNTHNANEQLGYDYYRLIFQCRLLGRLAVDSHLRARIVESGAFDMIMQEIESDDEHKRIPFTFFYYMLSNENQTDTINSRRAAVSLATLFKDANISTHAKPHEYLLETRHRTFCVERGLSYDAWTECFTANKCTFSVSGKQGYIQWITECYTCNLRLRRDRGVCQPCLRTCHAGHETGGTVLYDNFICDCADEREKSVCQHLTPTVRISPVSYAE